MQAIQGLLSQATDYYQDYQVKGEIKKMITLEELKKIGEVNAADEAEKIENFLSDEITTAYKEGYSFKYFNWEDVLRSEVMPYLDKIAKSGFKVVVTKQTPKFDETGKYVDTLVNEVFIWWGK